MATKAKPRKKAPDILDKATVQNDWSKLIEQVKTNPVMYGAATAFLILCILGGLIYRASVSASARARMTELAKAVETEDPAMRATELDGLAQGKSKTAAEALYLEGEADFNAKDYAKAREIFEQVRSQFPDTPYAPNAIEGLGYVAESEKKLDEALADYKEILDKWPDSLAARRQQLNIGRCEEALKNPKEAIAAYKAETETFPGSSAAKDAEASLDRLKISNPDLFPVEKPPAAQPAAGTAAPVAQPMAGTAAPAPQAAAGTAAPAPKAETVPAAQPAAGTASPAPKPETAPTAQPAAGTAAPAATPPKAETAPAGTPAPKSHAHKAGAPAPKPHPSPKKSAPASN